MSGASVVIPSRGGRDRLPVILDALARQEGAEPQAVVVLDGDIDGSRDVLRAWEDRLRLDVVEFPENRGRAAALTAGFAAATEPVLIRADDDLEPHPRFAANHVAHHRGEPVGVIGMCPDVFPTAGRGAAYAAAYGRGADERLRRDAYAMAASERWRLWSGNVSVTRETYDRVGEYDPAFRAYGWEDVDWGYRLHELGVPIVIPDDVEALHHNPPLSATERAERAFESGASRRAFMRKHPQAPMASGRGSATNPWNVAVGAVAAGMRSPALVRAAGRPVDALITRSRGRAAEKSVALLVQAAARAAQR